MTVEQLQYEANRASPIQDQANPSSDAEVTNPEPVKQESNSGTDYLKTSLDDLKNKSDLVVYNNTSESDKLAHDSEKGVKSTGNQKRKYGGSLSLARIQSLVSMTTPRASNMSTVLGSPMFIEIDHSIDGFGCLFLPSVFPQQIQQMQGEGGPFTSFCIILYIHVLCA